MVAVLFLVGLQVRCALTYQYEITRNVLFFALDVLPSSPACSFQGVDPLALDDNQPVRQAARRDFPEPTVICVPEEVSVFTTSVVFVQFPDNPLPHC